MQRVELLAGNVRGNLATIGRHRAAIHMLAEYRAPTLLDVAAQEGAGQQPA